MKKIFIGLSLIIVIIILEFFINQEILPVGRLEKQIKERQKNILKETNKEYYEKQEQDKNETTKPMGAIILMTSKIKLADLELTGSEYATKKTQLIQDFNLKQLNLNDKERFIAMLNREISIWEKTNNQSFVLANVNQENIIDKILIKIK